MFLPAAAPVSQHLVEEYSAWSALALRLVVLNLASRLEPSLLAVTAQLPVSLVWLAKQAESRLFLELA